MIDTGKRFWQTLRGGRMIKWKGRAASMAPALASVSVIALSSAAAFGAVINTDLNVAQVFGDEDITITEDGSVNVLGVDDLGEVIEITTDYDSIFENSGLIGFGAASGHAQGIYVDGYLDDEGVIHNMSSGVISIISTGSADASLAGIYIYEDIEDGSLIQNDGTITVDAIVSGSNSATAYGILVDDDDSYGNYGTIRNNGAITVRAWTTDDYSVLAAGIAIDGEFGGLIENNGEMTVTGENTTGGEDITVDGIYISGDLYSEGIVRNSGDLTVIARASGTLTGEAEAFGIRIDQDVYGLIENTSDGVIDVDMFTNYADSGGYAYGIMAGSDLDGGRILNAGEIWVDHLDIGGGTASAYGVIIDNQISYGGSVDNSGDIYVAARSTTYEAAAYGIYVGDGVGEDGSGLIDNSGMIDVRATGYSLASAYGINISDEIGTQGIVRNSGDILVRAETSNDITFLNGSAYGISLGTLEAGGLLENTSTGMIEVDSIGVSQDAYAYGLNTGTVDGEIINAGMIDAYAMQINDHVGGTNYASTYGLLTGDIYGDVTNSGSIYANAVQGGDGITGDASAWAFGISSDNVESGASISNSGMIDVDSDAQETGASAYAFGVDTETIELGGSVSNSGGIYVDAIGQYASAFGVETTMVAGTLDVTSSGVIEVVAASDGTALGDGAFAYGFFVSGDVGGSVSSAGLIDVYASAGSGTASAIGMAISNNISSTGDVTNSGTLLVEAFSDLGDAVAAGQQIGGSVGGFSLHNTDTMEVTVDANSQATAHGQRVLGNVSGLVSNSGSLLISAISDNSNGVAYGQNVGVVESSGRVENTGLIDVYAEGDSNAYAVGINISSAFAGSEVSNSGMIMAEVTEGVGGGSAYGVNISDLDGTFFNSGDIVARNDADPTEAYAIYVNSGSGSVVLDTGTFIEGRIINNASTTIVDRSAGGSIAWTIEGSSTVLSSISDIPLFSSGNTILTYDASAIAASGNALADIASIGSDALQANLALAAGGADIGVAQGILGGGGLTYFISGDTASMDYDGNGTTTLNQSVDSSGISIGATGEMDNGLTFGVTAGSASADVSVNGSAMNSYNNDASGMFIGGSVATNYGGYIVDAGLRFGRLGHDDARTINNNLVQGGGVATASYNSTFFSPEVGIARTAYLGDLMVTPSARYRYTRQSINGYTETGTMVNATVGDRTVTVGQLDLGVDVSKNVGAGVVTGSIGLMHRNIGGDDSVSVTIAGDTNAVGVFSDDQTAATLGISYSQDIAPGMSFNVGADVVVGGGDVSGHSLNASFIAKF